MFSKLWKVPSAACIEVLTVPTSFQVVCCAILDTVLFDQIVTGY